MEPLPGAKTYILGIAMILTGAGAIGWRMFDKETAPMDVATAWGFILGGLTAMGLRLGVKKVEDRLPPKI